MRLEFQWVDVFTTRQFGGNPLAVFLDGRGVSTELMQTIARELNLSETTFVLPPQDPANDFRVRIFTPGSELPMAGHPTVGTTFVLDRLGMTGGRRQIRLEEGVGPIPVSIGEDGLITMTQLLPEFGPVFSDTALLARVLSLDPASVLPPAQVISCGMPFLMVRVAGIEAVRQIRFRADLADQLGDTTKEIYVFCTGGATAGAKTHGRMFAPGLGLIEDPATGAASGPLGCYLVRQGLIAHSPRVEILAEQGFEMGRPSLIHITIEMDGPRINAVHVGGRCRFVAEGHLEAPAVLT